MSDKFSSKRPLRPKTLAVRAGQNRAFQETSEGMFLTSGYAYNSPEEAAARFSGEAPGLIYSRFSNPTVQMFEERMAALEGTNTCFATATGMAAITATMLSLLNAGDHIVASRALFGSCRYVINDLCARFDIRASFVDGTDLGAWETAIEATTKVLFLESPSNPGLEVLDIAAIAAIADNANARLVVDNVFATPILQRPVALGAHIVTYSATKHVDGQGRVLGGAILSNDSAFMEDALYPFLRNTGPTLSAFNAWVLVKSLETLDLRVTAMCTTAHMLAERLAQLASNNALSKVTYPHLANHPQYMLAKEQMAMGGSIITIEFSGDPSNAQAHAFDFLRHLEIFDISNNLGDAKSLATHPRTTTHHKIGEESRQEQGITPGMVRLSIGLEDVEDLWEDLQHALMCSRRDVI